VVKTSWDQLDQQTCQLLLINTVALYEAWCYEISSAFYSAGVISEKKQRDYQGSLQYPNHYGPKPKDGINSTVKKLASADGVSAAMTALMSSVLPSAVDEATFTPRMRIYRLFKEARNSISHRGSVVGNEVCDAYNDCAALSPADIGMRKAPEFPAPVLGEQVRLSWRGIIGLSDMLRRVVADVDHLLMCTKTAELDLIERLRTDPAALQDPSEAGSVATYRYAKKLPDGPWIVTRAQLERGQSTIYSAAVRLLGLTKSRKEDFLVLWPDLLARGTVEIHSSLRDS